MMKLVAIDFETANGAMESACSIGVTVFEDGVLIDEFGYLIKPHPLVSRFDKMNIAIHGITPKQVENALEWDEVYLKLEPYFHDSIVVAHFAAFDMKVLTSVSRLYRIQLPEIHYFCTVESSRLIFPHLPRHKLNTMCEHLNISLNHHDAISDARACALIAVNSMNLVGEYDIVKFLNTCGCKLHKL